MRAFIDTRYALGRLSLAAVLGLIVGCEAREPTEPSNPRDAAAERLVDELAKVKTDIQPPVVVGPNERPAQSAESGGKSLDKTGPR
jgi:hypothetical protein